jgi:hypothetical protein
VQGLPLPAGTACDGDDDPATVETCDGAGNCVVDQVVTCDPCSAPNTAHQCEPTPFGFNQLIGCSAPPHANATLTLSGGARQRVRWKFAGVAPGEGLFGSPTTDTDYRLCVFARSDPAAPWVLLANPRAAAGARWRQTPAGWTFRDARSTDGLRGVTLVGPASPRSKVLVSGGGAGFMVPSDLTALGLAATGEVRVELRAEGSWCWASAFTGADFSSLKTKRLRATDGGQ